MHRFVLDQPDLKPCDYHAISEEGFCELCIILENADCHGNGWKALAERIGITPHPYILNIEHRAVYQRRSPAAIVLDFFFKDSVENPLEALKNLSNICYKIDNLAAKDVVDNEIMSIERQIIIMQRRKSSVTSAVVVKTPPREIHDKETHLVTPVTEPPVESLGAGGVVTKSKESDKRRKSLRTTIFMSKGRKWMSSFKRPKTKSNSENADSISEEEQHPKGGDNSGQFNEAFVTDLGRPLGFPARCTGTQGTLDDHHHITTNKAMQGKMISIIKDVVG